MNSNISFSGSLGFYFAFCPSRNKALVSNVRFNSAYNALIQECYCYKNSKTYYTLPLKQSTPTTEWITRSDTVSTRWKGTAFFNWYLCHLMAKKVALKTIHYNNLLLFIQNISTFLIGSNPAVYSYTLLARIDQIWKQFVMYG